MGFSALKNEIDKIRLKEEFRAGERLGLVTLGENVFFFKAGFKKYYIPYSEIKRCFRRVHVVPIRNKKTGENSLQIESVVLSDGEKELAQIQVPGKKAAEELLEKVVSKNPEISTELPRKLQKMNEHNSENIVL